MLNFAQRDGVEFIYGENTVGMSAVLEVLERAAEKPKRVPVKPGRTSWAEELIAWFRARGTPSLKRICERLGIDPATLWRWRRGGPILMEHVEVIRQITDGEIDPLTRRRWTPTQTERRP